ncbi:acyltransferase family protein [Paraburkholderia sp. A1RO-1]|uniref:acyltransferase family protein n=1 Tax=Paraburkholderia sp. A1RO-1 TaxID=3028368 RepID=UPI003B7F92AE
MQQPAQARDQGPSSKRLFFLDFIRALSVLMIILYHFDIQLLGQAASAHTVAGFVWFNQAVGDLGVTLFIMISGIALMTSASGQFSVAEFYKKRILAIFPSYWITYVAVGCVLFLIRGFWVGDDQHWKIILTATGFDGLTLYRGANYYLIGEWFIGFILCMYLMFPLLRRGVLERPLVTWLSAIALFFVLHRYYDLIFTLNENRNPLVRLPEFLFGLCFLRYVMPMHRYALGISVVALALFSFWAPPIPMQLYGVLLGIAVFCALSYIAEKVAFPVIFVRYVEAVSRYSFLAFLLHHQIIYVLLPHFNAAALTPVEVYVLFALVIGLSFAAAKVLHKPVENLTNLLRRALFARNGSSSPEKTSADPDSRTGLLPWKCIRFGQILGISGAVLAAVFFIPFLPGMPGAGIDYSWMMAVNETLARELVFGKNMIFTSGPLSPIYTTSYAPQTNWISFWGSIPVATAVFGGFLLISRRSARWMLIALPFATAAALLRDSIHYALGLVFLLFVFRLTRPDDDELYLPWTRFNRIALLVLTTVLWWLPLIKGSFGAIVYGVTGLSIAMLARASKNKYALLLPIVGLISLAVSWSMVGQPLLDLPHFFIAQKPIISSYTDAMSIMGSAAARRWWIFSAVVMTIVSAVFLARDRGIDGVLCILGMMGCLFVAFKTGFVRQDGHIWTSTSFVLFAAIAVASMTEAAVGVPLIIAAAIGATAIDNSVMPRDPSFYPVRFAEMIEKTSIGVHARLNDELPSLYAGALDKIRTDYPLPECHGSA